LLTKTLSKNLNNAKDHQILLLGLAILRFLTVTKLT
jgi:hypothetical protein